MDAELWPELKEQVTALLEEREYIDTLPVSYAIKTIKGSINDFKKFQNDERFPQKIISKWVTTFDDWLQDAIRRKARQDVCIIMRALICV